MSKILAILVLAVLLGGCAARGPVSIAGGECRIFEAPKYEVRGQRDYDQDWIDSQIEGGVGGCKWKRPAPRPASIDQAPITRPAPAQPKRRGIVQRIRDRVLPAPAAAAPIAPVWPSSPPAPVEVTPPAPDPRPVPRPPRSAIERLLQPRDDD